MADGFMLDCQKAVIAALKADAGVAALVGSRVYDEPPQTATFPFVRIGPMDLSELDDFNAATRAEVSFGVEAHSRPEGGKVEASRIAAAVRKALHRNEAALSALAEHNAIYCFSDVQDVRRSSDGLSYEAMTAFRILLEET